MSTHFLYLISSSVREKHTHVLLLAHILLHLADPPRITRDLQNLKDALCGKPVTFTAEVTGTEPLNYQWEWKQAIDDDGWQPCDGETFIGADSSRLTIPSVQKSTEGSYRCVVSNCAGNQTSNPAELSVGKNQTVNAECKVCVTPMFCFHVQLRLPESPLINKI